MAAAGWPLGGQDHLIVVFVIEGWNKGMDSTDQSCVFTALSSFARINSHHNTGVHARVPPGAAAG